MRPYNAGPPFQFLPLYPSVFSPGNTFNCYSRLNVFCRPLLASILHTDINTK